jgi:hypothetical protein
MSLTRKSTPACYPSWTWTPYRFGSLGPNPSFKTPMTRPHPDFKPGFRLSLPILLQVGYGEFRGGPPCHNFSIRFWVIQGRGGRLKH